MGLVLSKFIKLWNGFDEQASVAMLGLDGAGKTTVLYSLKSNEVANTSATIGFNVEQVSPGKGISFTILDVGGQAVIRPLWKNYLHNKQGLIYVVDASDEVRFGEAREELFKILELFKIWEYCEMQNVPVLLLANKQDLPNAKPMPEVTEAMEMHKLGTGREWYVQSCCATRGDGICEGFQHLAEMIKRHQKTLR